MFQRNRAQKGAGFTLVELIVAMAVLSVATTVFMKLFLASQEIARDTSDLLIAGELAQTRMHSLLHTPDRFEWTPREMGADTDTGALPVYDIKPRNDEPANFAPPHAVPTNPHAHEVTLAKYAGFTWSAMASRPSEVAQHYELTLVVRWQHGGRTKLYTLTNALPRGTVDPLLPPPVAAAPEPDSAAPAEDAS